MCIRDRATPDNPEPDSAYQIADYRHQAAKSQWDDFSSHSVCLLYTSDAADERSSVDLGGRRIIKKKTNY